MTIYRRIRLAAAGFICVILLIAFSDDLHAACNSAAQGEGRVVGVINVTTFRLDDGREVRLAGVEPSAENKTKATELLASLIDGRDVTLYGEDDQPDRYGRQWAFVAVKNPVVSVQTELLRQGAVMVSPTGSDRECSRELFAAENTARVPRRGLWASSAALKNAERPDDILVGVGRFLVVEGKVLSVRQAGATFYVNFGRRWTRDFAVTISKRIMASFESAGPDLNPW